jgi:ABC-2 type transport system permease protein
MTKISVILGGFIKYKDLLFELVGRDIKIRYRRSVLGLLWTILNPILMMLIMTLVFSSIFRFDIENFPVYFFAGNILFSFVIEATTNSLHSVTGNGDLIRKIYVPKYLFPMSNVLSSIVNLVASFFAMLLVMLFTKVPIHATMFLTPIILGYVIVFSLGLGMILATIQVFFRDTSHIYGVFSMAWMYLTPIFYPESLLADKMNFLLTLNPMVHFIRYMREIILYQSVPSYSENMTCFSISLIILIIGTVIFYKKQDKFILYI